MVKHMSIKKKLVSAMVGLGILVTASGSVMAETYEVVVGDTLSAIAYKYNIGLDSIVAMNPQIENINLIYPNQQINVLGKAKVTSPKASESPKQSSNEVNNVTVSRSKRSVTNGDNHLLAQLVEAEARGESYRGKVAVVEVVLNRVNSGKFPNSVHGVIYQSGQFSPVSNGSINNSPSEESYTAVYEALNNVDNGNTDGSLYFFNPRTATSAGWLSDRPTIKQIGNHVFKK